MEVTYLFELLYFRNFHTDSTFLITLKGEPHVKRSFLSRFLPFLFFYPTTTKKKKSKKYPNKYVHPFLIRRSITSEIIRTVAFEAAATVSKMTL